MSTGNLEVSAYVCRFSEPDPITPRNIRHGMDRLWPFVLSLILTEFFKGAYRVWDKWHGWDTVITLIACALFMSKQIADIFLYYARLHIYDPESAGEGKWLRLRRYLLGNTIEILILFLTYGAIQALSVHNLVDTLDHAGRLKRDAGAGLLLSTGLVELCWLWWDVLFIVKRLKGIAKTFGAKQAYLSARVWRAFRNEPDARTARIDGQVTLWMKCNFLFGIVFLLLWFYFHYKCQGWCPASPPNPNVPTARTAFWWLLFPMMFYFTTYQVCFMNYYIGEE
ncbi:hypothetical protein [Silvibacterium acidisoli]|uniref:hypothetical protein n=1 Tax=Acidobacteriaceae bacterium ZG23-2 TaxID=2883246 RepID=UPI00406D31C4